MNKELFVKVKDLCKDTGLSEKYLKAITEKIGGSIEDDSSDSEAIEATANLVAEVANESQGEATRWANKNKDPKPADPKDPKPAEPKPTDKTDGEDSEKRLKDLEKEISELKAEKVKGARSAEINSAMEKHKIPAYLRTRISVPEDQNPDEYIASFKQDLITNGLMSDQTEGVKAASTKQIEEAADALLESITVK